MKSENGKRVTLSRSNAFRLAKWLELNWDTIHGKMTVEEVEKHAAKELQFPVTINNIRAVSRDIGRIWNIKRAAPKSLKATRTRLLAKAILAVAMEVGRLAERLGERFDEGSRIDIAMLSKLAADPQPEQSKLSHG